MKFLKKLMSTFWLLRDAITVKENGDPKNVVMICC